MAPGPNSPIVQGMQERVRRGLIPGNMYVIFFKGQKLMGEFRGRFDQDHAIIRCNFNVLGRITRVNFVIDRRWVFELSESTALLN